MNLKVGVQDKELDNLLLKIQRLQKELAKIDIRINPEGFKELDDQLKKAMSDFEALYLKINEAKFKPTVDISELVKLQDEILKMREMFETNVVKPSTPEGADMNQKMADTTKELNQKTTEYLNQQAALSQEAKKLANEVLGSYGQNIKALSRVEGELKVVTAAKNQLNKAERDGLISTQDAIQERSTLINRELQLKASKNELQAILRNEIKTMQTAEGSIQSMALQLTRLQNTYDNLNVSERNSAQGKALLAHIQQTEQEFLKLNQTMNVGKITAAGTGFNSLGMSIQQVARELPSLKMGFGTFMLAISNNLPILADELQRAKTKYTDLVSSGQKATPVWKQVIGNLFSWQTALVAGVTALTLFAPKIVEWIDGLIKGNNTLKSTKELQESINEEFKNGSSSVGEQIVKINNLSDKWSILGGNLDKQKKFIVENKSEFDNLGISINNVKDAQNLLIDNKDVFISYLKEMAKATAASKLAADEYAKAIEKENEIRLMGVDPNNIQEVDKLKGGSISRDYVKAKVLNDERKEIEKNADALFHLGKAYESEAKKSLDAAGIKKSAKDKDKTKSTESAADKAREASLKLLNLQAELDSESVKQQLEYEQKLLDIEQDSFDKRYRQNQLNMAKELISIEEFRQKMIKDQQEAAKNIYIKNNGTDTGFNFATFDKTLLPQGLSDADIESQIKKRTDASLAAWKKGNEDIAKEQRAFADEEKLTFASQLDQQIYSIRKHYKERRDLAKGNSDLIKQIEKNESREIAEARLQAHQRQLESDAEYNQKYRELTTDRYFFESDKRRASLQQQIKDQKKIFNDLEKRVMNDPNNDELARQLREAYLRLRILNKEWEKTPEQKLAEIAGIFKEITGSLSNITGVDLSMLSNAVSGIASFATGDFMGAASSGMGIVSTFITGFISQKERQAEIQREINKLQQQYNIDLRQQNYDLISSIDYARAFKDNLEALQWLIDKGFISEVDYSAWEALVKQSDEARKNFEIAKKNSDSILSDTNKTLDSLYKDFVKGSAGDAIGNQAKPIISILKDWKNGIIDNEEAFRRLGATGWKGMSDIADKIARSDEETQKWTDQIAELSQQMDEFATGTSFDSFLSDAANAISDLRGNVTSLADFTEEKLTNAILSSFKYQILSNALKPMYNELADMFLSGNYDASAANDWKQRLTDILNTNSKELDKIFNAFGIDPKEVGSSSQTPSSGYSVSMSQDTGDKLVGIQTGSQMRLISIDNNVARIAQWNQPVSEKFNFDTIAMPFGALSQSSLRIERMIEEYKNISIQMFYLVRDIKSDTANLSAIKDGINSMNSKLDNI